jgi:membrane-bound lytic murein transglycosylase A
MSVRRLSVILLASVVAATSVGCRPKKKIDFNQELPPGQLALRKISPAEYPDFSVNHTGLDALSRSLANSAKYLTAPSSKQFFPYLDITHERAVATVAALQQVVEEERRQGFNGARFNGTIRSNFEVYKSIGAPNPEGPGFTDRVLFTGYFTPIYEASTTRQGEYVWPLYKRPADLVTDEMGQTAYRKTPEGSSVPYYTRAQIEQGNLLAGQEFVYLKSRWEAYVITIQGSARLKLMDQGGRIYEVGYNGNNGYAYTSPGRQMLADGVITKDQLSLRGLRAYFEQNPGAMDKYLGLNERFVFFTERPGGPFGSLNVPVTPFASIATDKAVYPRAMPAFLTVDVPATVGGTVPYRGFMMDQDTGGAIRASGRTDIYMGVGPQAEQLAGHQLNEGELYYVAVKPEMVQASVGGR